MQAIAVWIGLIGWTVLLIGVGHSMARIVDALERLGDVADLAFRVYTRGVVHPIELEGFDEDETEI